MRTLALTLLLTPPALPQFQILPSPTTADLRGIHAVSPEIAWASGTNGTVLRTSDAGAHWTICPVPPGADKLDFRGIQAFDAQTAIVMSSGKGDLSRLYKTTDACATWTLLFTNPDPEGFWDAIIIGNHFSEGLVIGDQVNERFAIFGALYTTDHGWLRINHTVASPKLRIDLPHAKREVLFAASNSVLSGGPGGDPSFVTGGEDGSFLHTIRWSRNLFVNDWWSSSLAVVPIPMQRGRSAGAFSFATREGCPDNHTCAYVVVGGDYTKPDGTTGNAAYGTARYQSEAPEQFLPAQTPPHGYRSSVAYSPATKTWITVGPNGTDVSTDDGRNWRALRPTPTDAPDADRNWNALSLPYVVG
ncbi:MAG: hypothetical protein M3O32_17300, partial [Actinomycetota bacterium]|nr:hypothetical protein [Actinomycetota bacterium]